jgi:hypothetical protein
MIHENFFPHPFKNLISVRAFALCVTPWNVNINFSCLSVEGFFGCCDTFNASLCDAVYEKVKYLPNRVVAEGFIHFFVRDFWVDLRFDLRYLGLDQ